MKKRILGFLILIAVFMIIIPLAILAAGAAVELERDPVLRIGGTLVEDGEYYIDGFTYTEKPENRTENYAYFKDGVLWLHSFSLNKQSSGAMLYVENMDLVIMVEDASAQFRCDDNVSDLCAIYAPGCDITVRKTDRNISGTLFCAGNYLENAIVCDDLTVYGVTCDLSTTYGDTVVATGNVSLYDCNFSVESDRGEGISCGGDIVAHNVNMEVYALNPQIGTAGEPPAANAISCDGSISLWRAKLKSVADANCIDLGGDLRIYGSSVDLGSGSAYSAVKLKTGSDIYVSDELASDELADIVAKIDYDGEKLAFDINDLESYRFLTIKEDEANYPSILFYGFEAEGPWTMIAKKGEPVSYKVSVDENEVYTLTFTGAAHLDEYVFRATAPNENSYIHLSHDFYPEDGIYTKDSSGSPEWREKQDLDSLNFNIEGYEVGAKFGDITVTAVDEIINIVDGSLKFSRPRDNDVFDGDQEIEADSYYWISFQFKLDRPDKYNFTFDMSDRYSFKMNGMVADAAPKYNAATDTYSINMTGEALPESDVELSFFEDGEATNASAIVSASGSYVLPTLEEIGVDDPRSRVFLGWKINGGGTVYSPGEYIFAYTDTSIVAHWEYLTPHTVTLHRNDGSGKTDTVTVYETEWYYSEDFPKPDRLEGRTFFGWGSTADTNNIIDGFSPTEDVELYAVLAYYPDKFTFTLEGYEIGAGVSDVKLTDDIGFLRSHFLSFAEENQFFISPDIDGYPAMFKSEEDAKAAWDFMQNGVFEENKSYWITILGPVAEGEGAGFFVGFENRLIIPVNGADGYDLTNGFEEKQFTFYGDVFLVLFKLQPLEAEKPEDPKPEETTKTPETTETEAPIATETTEAIPPVETETETNTTLGTETETEPDTDTTLGTETESEAETAVGTEAEPGTDTETVTENGTDADTGAETVTPDGSDTENAGDSAENNGLGSGCGGGCGSSVSFGAITLVTAFAAGFTLIARKRED